MSPFPVHFTSRWDNPSRLSYDDAVCWHVLLGRDTAVQAAAATARERLARFAGLHMTPPEWLHVTILRAGTADTMTQNDMSRMLTRAQAELARTAPVTVTLRRVFYHPEAIVLGVSPGSALDSVLAAARTATREVLGSDAAQDDEFAPHLTLCYSTEEQPAAPVIAELGKTLPPCEVTIGELSLVVQDGPEDQWNWRVAGKARLLGGLDASGVLPVRAVCACPTSDAPPALEAAGIVIPGRCMERTQDDGPYRVPERPAAPEPNSLVPAADVLAVDAEGRLLLQKHGGVDRDGGVGGEAAQQAEAAFLGDGLPCVVVLAGMSRRPGCASGRRSR